MIEEVVGDYVPLKKKGQNMWACCPFHNEKSPSFSVSPAKGIYKCFGCGKAGDSVQFVMDIEGVNYPEAIRHLAKKYGVEIEEEEEISDEQQQRYNERESMLIALNYAKEFFKLNLETEEGKSIGLSYFYERGFSKEIIQKFDLGYALDKWDALLTSAQKQGYEKEILEKCGLIIPKEDRFYDRFRGRVIFPIHNVAGKPIAFGARILKADKNQPKYINSPETEVYHKSDVLYGISQAKQALRAKDNCYLVEGYTDVISLHLSGIENVVASSGTSLTEGQIALIKRFTDNVTVLFDGDQAGIKASLRGIDLLLAGGLNVKAVVFPDGEDPDSYSQKLGSSDFQQYLLAQAKDFMTFKLDLVADDLAKDPIKKAEVIREVVISISKIPDPLKRAVYIKDCSLHLEIEESLLYSELNKLLLKSKADTERSESFTNPPLLDQELIEDIASSTSATQDQIIALQERETVRMLIVYGFQNLDENIKVAEYLLQELEEVDFQTPIYSQMIAIYKEALAKGHIPDADYFLKVDDSQIKNEVIHMISTKYELSEHWTGRHSIFISDEADNLHDAIFNNVLRLKLRIVQKLMKQNMDEMKVVSESDLEKIILIHIELKKVEVEIARQLGIVITR